MLAPFKRAGFDLLPHAKMPATHSSVSTYSLLLTNVQICVSVCRVVSKKPLLPSRRSSPKSRPLNLLQPLSPLFPAPVLCFQQLAASFPKTPGVGVPMHASLSESATCGLFSVSAQRPLRLCVILGPRIRLTKGRSNTETTNCSNYL